MVALAPYYHAEQPLDFFFEMYLIDVLELLPEETVQALDRFSNTYADMFATHDGDWKKYVIAEMHLSDTIEVAIWDLWIKNSETLRQRGEEYHPWDYAQDFLENYLAEDSEVDVWEGDALQQARARIAAYRRDLSPAD